MRHGFNGCTRAVCIAALLGLGVTAAHAGKITEFDPPNSIETDPLSINRSGTVAGYFQDTTGTPHGFTRDVAGTITVFDDIFVAINDGGTLAGDDSQVGILRAPDGTITTFAPQGSQSITLTALNNKGVVAGYFDDSGDVVEGFIRNSNGHITTFIVPGATETVVHAIDGHGDVTGSWEDSAGHQHGFLRSPDGTITSFDVPGVIATDPTGINNLGVIAGRCFGAGSPSFIRAPDGTFTTFTVPGASSTFATGISGADRVAGWAVASGFVFEGFIRAPAGNFIVFQAHDAGAGYGQGTMPTAISGSAVTGFYYDSNNIHHGFVRTP